MVSTSRPGRAPQIQPVRVRLFKDPSAHKIFWRRAASWIAICEASQAAGRLIRDRPLPRSSARCEAAEPRVMTGLLEPRALIEWHGQNIG
jgi:hypothetical protein